MSVNIKNIKIAPYFHIQFSVLIKNLKQQKKVNIFSWSLLYHSPCRTTRLIWATNSRLPIPLPPTNRAFVFWNWNAVMLKARQRRDRGRFQNEPVHTNRSSAVYRRPIAVQVAGRARRTELHHTHTPSKEASAEHIHKTTTKIMRRIGHWIMSHYSRNTESNLR
jgi:hypothetical protein